MGKTLIFHLIREPIVMEMGSQIDQTSLPLEYLVTDFPHMFVKEITQTPIFCWKSFYTDFEQLYGCIVEIVKVLSNVINRSSLLPLQIYFPRAEFVTQPFIS